MKTKRRNVKKANPKTLARIKTRATPRETRQTGDADPFEPLWSHDIYERWIDKLDVDPKYKNMLKKLLKVTRQIGNRMVEIGKKVIEIIVWALRQYPKTAAAAIIGTILTLMAAHVPFLGPILAPMMATVTIVVVAIIFVDQSVKIHICDAFAPLRKIFL